MKRNYTLTTSDAAQKALDAYRVRLSALDSAVDKLRKLESAHDEVYSAFKAALGDYRKERGTRFAEHTDSLKDLSAKKDLAYAEISRQNLVIDALQESAARAATAYAGQMVEANADLIDGVTVTYKCFSDFLDRVSEPLGSNISVSLYTHFCGSVVEIKAHFGGHDHNRSFKICSSRVFSAEHMPTMPDDVGADPSAIYAAAEAYADIRTQVEAARDAYKAQIVELEDRVGALSQYALETLSQAARY